MRKITVLFLFLGTMVALILLQDLALEKSPEQVRENSRTQLSDLPAKDMVPTYIGTLFLGSFRALAIDVFWIQLKEAQDERRWYQAREIMEMISKLQPHNEEVWSMLAWDSAYNIANSEEQISYDRAWKLSPMIPGNRSSPTLALRRRGIGRIHAEGPKQVRAA